jgi:tRNA-uridine 2-sulfurtransferase
MTQPIKAVGMISGGLDSTLAAALIRRQGVEVHGVNFSTGFCLDDHKRAQVRNKDKEKPKRHEALRAGADLEFPVEIIDIAQEYQKVVTDPKYGYGSAMNPCIDCRIFMFRRAKDYMDEIGAKFLFTGEVLGQRPMSQHRRAMETIARDSGLGEYVVRPLSAKLLPPTAPEKFGWLDREKLGDISGRSRKGQMALAEELGVTDWPQPAGGCCSLIDSNYARRLGDMWEAKGEKTYTVEEATLLKVGRHFRLSPNVKLIVGRDEGENNFLKRYAEGRYVLHARDAKGPTALGETTRPGDVPADEDLRAMAGIVARYCDSKDSSVAVTCASNGTESVFTVPPADEAWLDEKRI